MNKESTDQLTDWLAG